METTASKVYPTNPLAKQNVEENGETDMAVDTSAPVIWRDLTTITPL